MRRANRHDGKHGLPEDRRDLIRSYMAGAEAPPDPSETLQPGDDGAEPLGASVPPSPEAAPEKPEPLRLVPGDSSDREEQSPVLPEVEQLPVDFAAARRTLEEVVRLCEQLHALRAESGRHREVATAAVSQLRATTRGSRS